MQKEIKAQQERDRKEREIAVKKEKMDEIKSRLMK